MKKKQDEYESLTYTSMESECFPSMNNTSSFMCPVDGNTSCGLKSLTLRESEAIHVIKHLEDQVFYPIGGHPFL